MRIGGALAAMLALLAGTAAAAPRAPRSIYAFANHCFTVKGTASPLYFKATGLGTYLIGDRDGKLLGGEHNEWTATRAGTGAGRFAFTSQAGTLKGRFRPATGCKPFPEAALNATGRPRRSVDRKGRLFGYADVHVHVTADLRAGGNVIYGENFDRFGIAEALGHDDRAHGSDGSLDVTGNLLRSGSPAGTHDIHGWPTFGGWPTFDTNTHQQIYYRWLQRDWKAGLRLITAQLVEDAPLCQIEPLRTHSCDETATIELEVARMRALQDYVDAQAGGPGHGWLRIVTSPLQARRAIERGKLAVLLGVEASNPFGCSEYLGAPRCDREDVDRGIALYKRLGISAMFVAHWVDNAFAGAALEEGDKGTFIGAMQAEQTGLPFSTGPCPAPEQGDACNTKGLTDLGAYLVGRLMDNQMLIEVDHLSERARLAVLDIAEQRHYPLLSSHTGTGGVWTAGELKRLYALGGFATARPDSAAKLAQSIISFKRYGARGVALGTDTGGFATLPQPEPGKLSYPFRSYNGVSFSCQVTGERKFDFTKDGVAHYGLFADLLAAMRAQKDGEASSALLFGSAEAYLRTWARATAP